jgi:hypothetical protein
MRHECFETQELIALAALTIRTGWIWNYINYDSALEYGVYAHGGPGVKEVVKQIDELSQRSTGGKLLKVGFDADASWPFYWYLRDYPNKFQMSNTPSRTDLDVPVIISSGATVTVQAPCFIITSGPLVISLAAPRTDRNLKTSGFASLSSSTAFRMSDCPSQLVKANCSCSMTIPATVSGYRGQPAQPGEIDDRGRRPRWFGVNRHPIARADVKRHLKRQRQRRHFRRH